MINKILVAVDGSNHSMKGVDCACEIAAALKAKVIILYVVKVQELPKGLREYAKLEQIVGTDVEVLMNLAGNLVSSEEKRAKEMGVDDVVCEVKEGPVARTIIARAEHHEAGMIVIGSRGLGSVEAALRGGISHRVELLAKCPVLIVK